MISQGFVVKGDHRSELNTVDVNFFNVPDSNMIVIGNDFDSGESSIRDLSKREVLDFDLGFAGLFLFHR